MAAANQSMFEVHASVYYINLLNIKLPDAFDEAIQQTVIAEQVTCSTPIRPPRDTHICVHILFYGPICAGLVYVAPWLSNQDVQKAQFEQFTALTLAETAVQTSELDAAIILVNVSFNNFWMGDMVLVVAVL